MDKGPSLFEFYDIAHTMAVFMVRFNPDDWLTEGHEYDTYIAEDLVTGLNRLPMPIDDNTGFFKLSSLVLDHAFAIFYTKHMRHSYDRKVIYEGRKKLSMVDYGRFTDKICFTYTLPKFNPYHKYKQGQVVTDANGNDIIITFEHLKDEVC